MPREQFETSNTIQFTFVSSVAPDAEPILKITGLDGSVISCLTSIQSSSTSYYVMYTMPVSEGPYMGEWYAEKTVVGTAYPFVKRFVFNNIITKRVI